VACYASGDYCKNYLSPRLAAIINIPDKAVTQISTHILPHKGWWLVLGWVSTKEGNPRLCIDYIFTYLILYFSK